jgi:c-di-GMP-binding flagellar brake protein YcgR
MSVEIAARLRFGNREVAFPMVNTCDISAEGLGLVLRDGRDGAFAVLDAWQDQVEIELDLPDGNWLKLPAKIAWRRTDPDDGGERLRVGLEFGEIGEADRKALQSYIQ